MTNGRLMLFLKGERRDGQVLIPEDVADALYERLALAAKLSTMLAILSANEEPRDELTKKMWEDALRLQAEWERLSMGAYLSGQVTYVDFLSIQKVKPEKNFFQRLWPHYQRPWKTAQDPQGMITGARKSILK